MRPNIAIDGPAGAGKSSVARGLARRLGYTYIDTGAMYRAVAYRALQAGLDVNTDPEAIAELAGRLRFEFREVDGARHLFVDGEDVEGPIRTREVGNLSSPVSAIPGVRRHLVAAQQRMARNGGCVMEGRDIGTVVLPDAKVKVFLTASAAVRARRRQLQLAQRGIHRSLEEILRDQKERDERDSNRSIAPLRQADDAVLIDTDNMTEDQVIEAIIALVRKVTGDAQGA